jgi:hypothetical protein
MAGKYITVQFPIEGYSKGKAVEEQPPKSSFLLQNVRVFDTILGRIRGGSRSGVDYIDNGIGDSSNGVLIFGFTAYKIE